LMKLNKVKYSKIAVVVFLTALIWIWADLALNEEYPLPRVTIKMGRSRPSLWISFGGESAVDINDVVLKGPVSKMSELKRIIRNDPQKLEFTLNAEQQGMLDPGEHPRSVSDFIKNIDWIRALGLTVEDCEPNVVNVSVVKLVQKDLEVRCFDGDGQSCTPESIVPDKVSMFVPDSWSGERLVARVVLTRADIENARSVGVVKKPFIELVTGQTYRYAEESVRIKMPPEGDLESYTVENPTLGYAFSLNTQGKYVAEVKNKEDVLIIAIRATPAAKQAYEDMLFKVMLEIDDKDRDFEEGKLIKRQVSYKFPIGFVENGDIKLDQEPVEAEFILVPVSPENP